MDTETKKKGRVSSVLLGILIFIIGVILILCNKLISGQGIVVVAGILFILTGFINLALYVTRKNADGTPVNTGFTLFLGWLVSIAAIILGVCMLVFTDTFNVMVPYVFGILIFFGAIMLAYTYLFVIRKLIHIPAWVWIFPFSMIILGIIVLTRQAVVDDSLIMILTGVSMILYGLSEMLTGALRSGVKRTLQAEEKEHAKENEEISQPQD